MLLRRNPPEASDHAEPTAHPERDFAEGVIAARMWGKMVARDMADAGQDGEGEGFFGKVGGERLWRAVAEFQPERDGCAVADTNPNDVLRAEREFVVHIAFD